MRMDFPFEIRMQTDMKQLINKTLSLRTLHAMQINGQ